MPIKLVYHGIRGLGEPARLLLRHQAADWVDEHIVIDRWLAMKNDEDLPFGNLPFIDDDGKKISQSCTVMRYLGRKFDLMPKSDDDVVKAEIVEQEIYDLRNRFTRTIHNIFRGGSETGIFDYEFMKGIFIERLKERLPKFEELLTGSFILGDDISYVDFMVCEYLDQFRDFAPQLFEDLPNIGSYLARFQGLPHLKEWYESEGYQTMIINPAFCEWYTKQEFPVSL